MKISRNAVFYTFKEQNGFVMKQATIYRHQKVGNLVEEEPTINSLSMMGNPLEQQSYLVDVEMPSTSLGDLLVNNVRCVNMYAQVS